MRIFLIGYMGSGKTTIGKTIAKLLDMQFIDMDEKIEMQQHRAVSEIFSELGEEKFRELERQCLHEVAEYDNSIISTGGGAPCFFDNMELMNQKGITIYINLNPSQLADRLKTTQLHKRPLLAGKDKHELENFIADNLINRDRFYKSAQYLVDGNDDEITIKIINIINQNECHNTK